MLIQELFHSLGYAILSDYHDRDLLIDSLSLTRLFLGQVAARASAFA